MATMHFVVRYEDGTTVECHPGQREMAAWEMEPFGCGMKAAIEHKWNTFMRYACWQWLRRTRGEQRTFKVWSAQVDEVEDNPAEDADPDPTSPDQQPGD